MGAQFFNFKIGKGTIDDLFTEILVDVLEYHPINAERWLTHLKSIKTADLRPLPDRYRYKERVEAAYQPAEFYVGQYSVFYHISMDKNVIMINIDDNDFALDIPRILNEQRLPPSDKQLTAINECVAQVIKEIAIETEKVINKYHPTYKKNSLKQQALKSK